jgi:hypothetical protein
MANVHLIFLVHGMGDFKPGWSESAQKTLRDQYAAYTALKFIPFNQRFAFVEINYNDEFEALREMWRNMNKALGDALVGHGGEVGKTDDDKKLIKDLNDVAGVANKNTFLTTHVLDALLYVAARQTAATVRESVRKQILAALKKQVDAGGTLRWSVVAHSLGTAVVHDALHEAYSDKPTSAKAGKLVNITRPACLAMIANVSRFLEWDIDAFLSRVKPGSPDEPDAACRAYLNARNLFDPFTHPKPFRPAAQWPSLGVRALGLYSEPEISTIEAPEKVHDLDHYLRNPRVHGPLFNYMVGQEVLDQSTIEDAHAAYVANTPLGKFSEFVAALKKFDLANETSWVEIFKKWAAFKSGIA